WILRGTHAVFFFLISVWSSPLISIPDLKTWCGWEGGPPKGLVWMGGGPHAIFYLLWCWFLNVILPFFLHYSSEIHLSLPPAKRESFLGIYIPKGNNVYFEFIKRYKVFCNFGESDF
ncbi:unnamed protein product, partial [Staurois parvus]